MNWLAHGFLSEPNIEFRLGNLLSDLVRGDARAAVGAEFLRGAHCHHAIDAFTDAHPIVLRSRARIAAVPRSFENFARYVRQPTGRMTGYSEKILSDAEMTDIYAFLRSLPAARPPSEIPLLEQLRKR